jgi:CubicO group peptidase (beta-lactamase class C family)
MSNKMALLILSVFCQLNTIAQPSAFKRLDGSALLFASADSIIVKLMGEAKITGLCISVLNYNKPVYTKAFGLKNTATAEALDTATVLYAASYSKAVFAYLVMEEVQAGKMDLDKPLYQYLDKPIPEYEKYKDLAGDDRWKLITARMCLSHTTGFPNWRFLNANTGNYDPKGKLAIYFTPGSRYAYSGEGLVLLQFVLEKTTGKPLQDLAAEMIFTPVGMMRTAYTWQAGFENDYATGYDEAGKPIAIKKRNVANAAGSLVSSIADLPMFCRREGLIKRQMRSCSVHR